jgi:hypothetical protein
MESSLEVLLRTGDAAVVHCAGHNFLDIIMVQHTQCNGGGAVVWMLPDSESGCFSCKQLSSLFVNPPHHHHRWHHAGAPLV